MTETDATKPFQMPERFVPYIDRLRIYVLFKEMLQDLIPALPKDHLKHIKAFLKHISHSSKDIDRVIILVSPELKDTLDVPKLAKELLKDLGTFVITRRCIMDHYEKSDDYEPGCISPEKMSEITKLLTLKDPVMTSGWLMFDHPCTVREARCLQQDGVLPSVTLVLTPPPQPLTKDSHTPARTFFEQDFEGLKFAYKATLKEVIIEKDDQDINKIAARCFNAIRASSAGVQGPGQGYHVVGAPGVYRVLIIGPLGSGRRTQARMLAKHFGLVFLLFCDIYNEAKERNDEIGESLRKYGSSVALKAAIVRRRLLQKDCLEHGWILNGYPENGIDFEQLEKMPNPPNRIIFLNCDKALCRERCMSVAVDWCTGKRVPMGSGPRAVPHPEHPELDAELDYYFTEALAELRASAGMTAKEVSAEGTLEEVNMRLQAAIIAAPPFNIETCPGMFKRAKAK